MPLLPLVGLRRRYSARQRLRAPELTAVGVRRVERLIQAFGPSSGGMVSGDHPNMIADRQTQWRIAYPMTGWGIRRRFASRRPSGSNWSRPIRSRGGSTEAGDTTDPVIAWRVLSDRAGKQVWLKCEKLQRTRSFKPCDAYNRIANLTNEDRVRGVVAARQPFAGRYMMLVDAAHQ
jgi:hypothetical protein